MTNNIEEFLRQQCSLEIDSSGEPTERSLQVATLGLMIEMAKADHSVPPEELNLIVRSMNWAFDLTDNQTGELLDIASFMLKEGSALTKFIDIVNSKFDANQKQRVLGMIWKVVLSDGIVDRYEATLAAHLRTKLNLTMEQAVRARQMAERGDFDPVEFELELSLDKED